MNTAQIIDAIVLQGGFDTSATDTARSVILQWVQECYDFALSETGWRKATISLGPTVANQSQYAIPANVTDLASLRVDGSTPWLRVTTEDLWNLQGGIGAIEGDAPGAFAPNFEADADQVFELWPTPTTAGLSISGLCETIDSTALTDGSGSTPGLPAHLHQRVLVDGAISIGRVRINERPDLAASFVASRDSGLKALKKLSVSRVGSGVWTARVAGG